MLLLVGFCYALVTCQSKRKYLVKKRLIYIVIVEEKKLVYSYDDTRVQKSCLSKGNLSFVVYEAD